MGDFNINLLNFDKHAETTSFVDMLHAQSFVSPINSPTRVTKNSATLIDNIFINCYYNIEHTFQCLIYTDVSDHFPIVHIDFEMKLCDTDTSVTRRNLSYKNRQRFYESISSVNYANPVYAVPTICHQVRWLRWGHPSLFHTATSLLIWYKMFCVRDISHRLMWVEFINMFSVYAQSGTHSRFNW